MLRFESPLAFVLLLLIPLVLEPETRRLLFQSLKFKKPVKAAPLISGLAFASPVNLSKLPGTWKTRKRSSLLSLLRLVTFILLVFALARPQAGKAYTETEASGRDLMLVLDLSRSMEAMDFKLDGKPVNRLRALQYVVQQFIDARAGDRIGLIVFGEQVFTQCPLTTDHETLKDFVRALRIGMAGDGTAIGDALGIALKRVKDIPGNTRTVILVTDGKSNSGTLAPLQAADVAKSLNIKVHSVGIGGEGMAPFPVPAPTLFGGGVNYQMVPVEYDEKTLRKIAETTGGQYFNARDISGLQQVYQQIDNLEERQEKVERYVQYQEQYMPLTVLAIILATLYEILVATVFLKVP